jgi:hypothetical protein
VQDLIQNDRTRNRQTLITQDLTQKGLKWDKNKGTKDYLLIVDDAGVVGVLQGDIRLLFIWVPIDGGLDGGLDEGGGRCTGS